MRLDSLIPTEMAQFIANLLVALSGTELAAIDPHVRTALIAAIGTLPTDLATQDAEAEQADLKAEAARSKRDNTAFNALTVCRQVRDTLKSSRAPKDQFDLCGFDFADKTRSTYVAQTPSELAVVGFSNGVNKGTFKGNNKSSAVMFEVYRREGDEGDWALRMAVKPPRFTDPGVTPGQYYEYKVRAKASSNVSEFSNSAVVYGSTAGKPAGD